MDRVPGSATGWKIVVQDIKTGKTTEETWDKVVLAIGVRPTMSKSYDEQAELLTIVRHPLNQSSNNASMPPALSDPAAVASFDGIITHSSKITASVHDKILALPPATAKIVVVGFGKSAIDLAGIYAGLGRDVTVVYKKVRIPLSPR